MAWFKGIIQGFTFALDSVTSASIDSKSRRILSRSSGLALTRSELVVGSATTRTGGLGLGAGAGAAPRPRNWLKNGLPPKGNGCVVGLTPLKASLRLLA